MDARDIVNARRRAHLADTSDRFPTLSSVFDNVEYPKDFKPTSIQKYDGKEVLALLKYPFYPLFNFDNGMNLISKSLTILTSAQLLVVFAFAHIFCRYFVFAAF